MPYPPQGTGATAADIDAFIAAHAADLDAHMEDWGRIQRTGEYLIPIHSWQSQATAPLILDSIYALPFFVARAITIDRLAIEITTADAGKIARLGIYNNGTNLYPGTLILDAGTVSVGANAVVAATINQALTKGLYWLVVVSDGNPSGRYQYPAWTPMGINPTNFILSRFNAGWINAAIGAGALANPFAGGGTIKAQRVPYVGPRLLSLD